MEGRPLTVFHTWQYCLLGRAGALELLYIDHPGYSGEILAQRAKKLLCYLLMTSALHQDNEDIVVLIDSTPPAMTRALDDHKHFVEHPCIPKSESTHRSSLV